jgi:hypothetical protein
VFYFFFIYERRSKLGKEGERTGELKESMWTKYEEIGSSKITVLWCDGEEEARTSLRRKIGKLAEISS